MSSTEKPTVLFVHGAWHIPEHYAKLTAMLRDAGFPVVIPHLPTCSHELPPPHTFADDCALIRREATQLAERGVYFIVAMHSYGGPVGTNSLAGLSATERAKSGQAGGAIRLFYLAAFLLPRNAYLALAFGGGLPPIMDEQPEQQTCTMKNPEYIFYDDVKDPAERAYWASLLTWHPTSAQKESGTVRYAAYRDIPTAYLVCEKDNGLLEVYQRGMIAGAEAPLTKQGEGEGEDAVESGGVFGGKIDVFTCDAGHSPYLTQPEVVVRCVEELSKAWLESSVAKEASDISANGVAADPKAVRATRWV